MSETCHCSWPRRMPTIGEAVPFLKPCAGHHVYGDWRAKNERAAIVDALRAHGFLDAAKFVESEKLDEEQR